MWTCTDPYVRRGGLLTVWNELPLVVRGIFSTHMLYAFETPVSKFPKLITKEKSTTKARYAGKLKEKLDENLLCWRVGKMELYCISRHSSFLQSHRSHGRGSVRRSVRAAPRRPARVWEGHGLPLNTCKSEGNEASYNQGLLSSKEGRTGNLWSAKYRQRRERKWFPSSECSSCVLITLDW